MLKVFFMYLKGYFKCQSAKTGGFSFTEEVRKKYFITYFFISRW